jgi:hypothetical protein
VISVSWANFIKDNIIIDKIQKAINYAVLGKNKLVVCAIGDAITFNDSRSQYPACCEHTLVTGAIPVKNELYPYMNASISIKASLSDQVASLRTEQASHVVTICDRIGSQTKCIQLSDFQLESNFQFLNFLPDQVEQKLV